MFNIKVNPRKAKQNLDLQSLSKEVLLSNYISKIKYFKIKGFSVRS
jgi:hypothetical protein